MYHSYALNSMLVIAFYQNNYACDLVPLKFSAPLFDVNDLNVPEFHFLFQIRKSSFDSSQLSRAIG